MSNFASNLFNLRVLLRYDDKYSVYVAQCLETGNVATADSSEAACGMIKELLEDEILFALKTGNIKNLFSSPAPMEVLVQWLNAAQKNDPKTVFLDVNFKDLEHYKIEHKNQSFGSNLTIAQAA